VFSLAAGLASPEVSRAHAVSVVPVPAGLARGLAVPDASESGLTVSDATTPRSLAESEMTALARLSGCLAVSGFNASGTTSMRLSVAGPWPIRSSTTIKFIQHLLRFNSFSLSLTAPEPVTTEKVFFPPLEHRKNNVQSFWREKLQSASTALVSTSLHVRLFHRPSVPAPVVPSPRPPLFSSKGSVSSFNGPLNFFHCPASLDGLQCPRGSFIHAPYCRFHMRSILHLDVVPSSIPGAGRGLFSLVPRSKGDHLVEYLGELISAQDVERRYPKGDVGIYCLSLSASLFIDSALSRGVGASANAARRNTKPNARFVADSRSGTARLEATRRIRADEEILLSYGRDYWQGARSSSHSTVDVPEWAWDLSDPFSPSASIPSPFCSCGSVF